MPVDDAGRPESFCALRLPAKAVKKRGLEESPRSLEEFVKGIVTGGITNVLGS